MILKTQHFFLTTAEIYGGEDRVLWQKGPFYCVLLTFEDVPDCFYHISHHFL